MKTRLVPMGRAMAVRLPRALVKQAQLDVEVEVQARKGCIVIRGTQKRRQGWADAARRVRDEGHDRLIDPVVSTRFDRDEWEW